MPNPESEASAPDVEPVTRRSYHTPQLVTYGELVSITAGVGGSGTDGGSFASVDLGA